MPPQHLRHWRLHVHLGVKALSPTHYVVEDAGGNKKAGGHWLDPLLLDVCIHHFHILAWSTCREEDFHGSPPPGSTAGWKSKSRLGRGSLGPPPDNWGHSVRWPQDSSSLSKMNPQDWGLGLGVSEMEYQQRGSSYWDLSPCQKGTSQSHLVNRIIACTTTTLSSRMGALKVARWRKGWERPIPRQTLPVVLWIWSSISCLPV